MSKELKIEDLPESVMKEINDLLNSDKDLIAMKVKKAELIRKRRIVQAIELSKKIESIEKEIVSKWLLSCEKEVVQMDTLLLNMPDEDKHRMNVYITGIIMMCDLVETFQMDADSLLKKYYPDCSIVMFDKFKDVANEAREQVRFMGRVTELRYQEKFGDNADNLNKLVYNKVDSFVKKMGRLRNGG